MRFLFDENLSEALIGAIASSFPNSLHVRLSGLGGASDRKVWEEARDHGLVLVTRDEDYRHLSARLGSPPKVIWIALGNCTTEEVATLLTIHAADIAHFIRDSDAAFLALGSPAS